MNTTAYAPDDITLAHFARATIKCIHNLHFNAASPAAIDVLTGLMLRYMNDLCRRTSMIAETRVFSSLQSLNCKMRACRRRKLRVAERFRICV